jgi:hypothetical protein
MISGYSSKRICDYHGRAPEHGSLRIPDALAPGESNRDCLRYCGSRSQNHIAARPTFRKGEGARKCKNRSELFSVRYEAKLLAFSVEKRIALEVHLWLYVRHQSMIERLHNRSIPILGFSTPQRCQKERAAHGGAKHG